MRNIYKYAVTKRFTLGNLMFDESDTLYIEEEVLEEDGLQMVFDSSKKYITDITLEFFNDLRNRLNKLD